MFQEWILNVYKVKWNLILLQAEQSSLDKMNSAHFHTQTVFKIYYTIFQVFA